MDDNDLIKLSLINFNRKCIPDIKIIEKINDDKSKILFYGSIKNGRVLPIRIIVSNDCLEFIIDLINELENSKKNVSFNNAINKIEEKYISDYSIFTILNEDDVKIFHKLEDLTIYEYSDIKDRLNNVIKYITLVERINDLEKEIQNLNLIMDEVNKNNVMRVNINYEFKNKVEIIFSKFKSYLDVTKNYLMNNYPDFTSLFYKLQEDEYNDNFAYRYCYHLRNAIQHNMEYPYESVEHQLVENLPNIRFIMTNQFFVNNHNGFDRNGKPKAFKKELLKNPNDKIDVFVQIKGMRDSILRIHDKLICEVLDEKLIEDMVGIYKFKAKYPEYDPYIFLNSKELKYIFKELKTKSNSEIEGKTGMVLIPMKYIESILKNINIQNKPKK